MDGGVEKFSFLATCAKTRRVPTRTTSPRSLSVALPPPIEFWVVEKSWCSPTNTRRFLLLLSLLPLLHWHQHHHNNHHHRRRRKTIATDARDGCIFDFAVAKSVIFGKETIPLEGTEDSLSRSTDQSGNRYSRISCNAFEIVMRGRERGGTDGGTEITVAGGERREGGKPVRKSCVSVEKFKLVGERQRGFSVVCDCRRGSWPERTVRDCCGLGR